MIKFFKKQVPFAGIAKNFQHTLVSFTFSKICLYSLWFVMPTNQFLLTFSKFIFFRIFFLRMSVDQ